MSGEKSNFFNRIIMVAGVFLLCTSVAMAEVINGSSYNPGTSSIVGGGTGGGYNPCSNTAAMSSNCATLLSEVTCIQGDVTCYKHESCATCPTGYKIEAKIDQCGKTYNTCVGNETLNPNPNPGLIGGWGQQWEDVTACACNCDEEYSWKTIAILLRIFVISSRVISLVIFPNNFICPRHGLCSWYIRRSRVVLPAPDTPDKK